MKKGKVLHITTCSLQRRLLSLLEQLAVNRGVKKYNKLRMYESTIAGPEVSIFPMPHMGGKMFNSI